MSAQLISIDNIDAFIFDFDGVLTNNHVYLNEHGEEFVSCNRSDGLAFDVLRKLKKPTFIVSTEKNLVVTARAKKLNVSVIQAVEKKTECVKDLAKRESFNLDKILYVGNDLNDYEVMQLCGLSVCPIDSHPKIKAIANITLTSNGGNGVVRELLEEILCLDFLRILY